MPEHYVENQRDIANPRLTDEQLADLEPLSTRHSLADGEAVFKAGEQIGGFFLIEAADFDEALSIAAKWPSARLGTIEVRPLEKGLDPQRRYS